MRAQGREAKRLARKTLYIYTYIHTLSALFLHYEGGKILVWGVSLVIWS